MNKFLKKILTVALALVCVISLVACTTENNADKETGLFCKKLGGVYTIYKYVDDGETVSLDIAKELEELKITDDKIVIKKQAFLGNSSLKEIIVPDSVTEIEKGAFAGMKSLESLTVPFVGLNAKSDVSVGYTAEESFKAVDAERTVAHFFGETEYEEGIAQTINFGTGDSQSANCYMPISLKKITVKGNNDIPACAFNGLSKYVQIVLDGEVKVIGDYAFANTAQLAEISLPSTVTKINQGAFYNATGLKKINLNALTSLTQIGDSAFEGSGLEKVETPASLISIGDKAFFTCTSLTEVKLNNGLKTIGNYAFMNCEKLKKVDTSSVIAKIETLGNYAFAYCEKLAEANYDLTKFDKVGVNAFKK